MVWSWYIDHSTHEPVLLEVPRCPTCHSTAMRCYQPSGHEKWGGWHVARERALAPLIGWPSYQPGDRCTDKRCMDAAEIHRDLLASPRSISPPSTRIRAMTSTPSVFTIGHSNKSFDEFAALLAAADIATVLDVRSYPKSRWPQYTAPALKLGLARLDVAYEPRGRNLGGKGANVDHESTMDLVADRVRAGEFLAVMCSEGDYLQCHRYTMLTPGFLRRGLDVTHLRYGGLAPIRQAANEEPRDLPEAPRMAQTPMF